MALGSGELSRYSIFALVAVLTVISLIAAFWSGWFWLGVLVFGALTAVGVADVTQNRHALLRN